MHIRFPTSTLLAGLALVWQALEPAAGQAGAPASELSIAAIMTRDWIGTPPEDPYWSGDGKSIYYRQRRAGSDVVDLYRTEIASGRTERIPPAELGRIEGPDGSWSPDRKLKAFIREGDLFVEERGRRFARQLTRTSDAESAPLVLATGESVAFRRGDAFHAIDLESGLDTTLAELRAAKDPDAPPDTAEFLAGQQLRLFEALAARQADKEELLADDRARRAADPTRSPPPFYLGEKRRILRADLSPSGDAPAGGARGAAPGERRAIPRRGGRQGGLDAGLHHRFWLRRGEEDPPEGRDRGCRISDAAASRPGPADPGRARSRRPSRHRRRSPGRASRRGTGRGAGEGGRSRSRRRDRFASQTCAGTRAGAGSHCSSSPPTTRTAGSRSSRRPHPERRCRQSSRSFTRATPPGSAGASPISVG